MTLNELNILNYRNIREANLSFSPNINCLIGNNGMGKTNVLDAIYFLSFCKSSFTTTDSLNITHDADFLMLQGQYMRADQLENISCGMKRGQKKHVKRNGKEYQRIADHIGLLPLVMISPRDVDLIVGGSENRRKLIDGIIAQTDRQYLHNLVVYSQLLKQRNALLKDENIDVNVLEVIDMQMSDLGQKIFAIRTAFIEQFTPYFQDFYNFIADCSKENVSLIYHSHLQQNDLMSDLMRLRERDQVVGFTTHGIHKDDIDLMLDDYLVRNVGSQGQQKTFLLALKFAQFAFLKQKHGFNPILLLDDLFDKLDSHRVSRIVELVNTDRFGQIFITDTDMAHIDEILKPIVLENKIFNVENGNVSAKI